MEENIMLDLETMGNHSNAAIIAIGAVKFDVYEITDRFYKVVYLESSVKAGLTMDASTVMWWMKQSEQARSQFSVESIDLVTALSMFSTWCGSGDKEMWGNGAAFDNVILGNAYDKVELDRPWNFWEDRCYRTVKNRHPEIELRRVGTYHNALDDAETQALHLIEINHSCDRGM